MASKEFKLEKDMSLKDMIKGLEVRQLRPPRLDSLGCGLEGRAGRALCRAAGVCSLAFQL
jgi:hypothetical protein